MTDPFPELLSMYYQMQKERPIGKYAKWYIGLDAEATLISYRAGTWWDPNSNNIHSPYTLCGIPVEVNEDIHPKLVILMDGKRQRLHHTA